MSYPIVPNTFTSATTFFATAMTGNFSSITSGLSSGLEDLSLYNIGATTCIVSSTIVCSSSITVDGTSTAPLTTTSLSTGSLTTKLLVAPVETCTISDYSITPTKSNIKVDGTTLYSIDTSNISEGDLLILSKSSTAVTLDSAGTDSNLKLGATTRTLTNASDRIVLQYVGSYFYELQFSSNG